MNTRERMTEVAAVLLTLATLIGLPLAVFGYQRHMVGREAAGARVIELYASSQAGV